MSTLGLLFACGALCYAQQPPPASSNLTPEFHYKTPVNLKDLIANSQPVLHSQTVTCSIPLTEVKPLARTAKMPVYKPPADLDPKIIAAPPAPPCPTR